MAGTATNIIQGSAEIFLATAVGSVVALPTWANTVSARTGGAGWTSVGFTSEGLDLNVEPEYLDVEVDQLLDSAALFKTGQRLTVATSFTEATLENLGFVLGQPAADVQAWEVSAPAINDDVTDAGTALSAAGDYKTLAVKGGSLGSAPLVRSFYAVGPGPRGADTATKFGERIYYMPRVISQESITVAVKRNEASQFPVTFRCLPDSNAPAGQEYGKVVDRLYGT